MSVRIKQSLSSDALASEENKQERLRILARTLSLNTQSDQLGNALRRTLSQVVEAEIPVELLTPVRDTAAVVVRDASKSITSPSTSVSSQIFAMQDHKIPVFSYLEKNMNLWDNIVVRFNAEPESGIDVLVESKMVERDRVEDIAGFLYASYGLDPESLGKFLGKK
jgi:Sec7-like guanine-nucleotide exchange factor